MILSKHQDKSFDSQTVFVSGGAFLRCKFTDCTLVMTNDNFHLDNCHFDRCNWQLNVLLLWGDRHTLEVVSGLIQQLNEAQKTLPADPEYAQTQSPPAPSAPQLALPSGRRPVTRIIKQPTAH
jgi:hypothetical protein